jgi:DNA primase
MDVKVLKEYIYENNKVEHILEALGCHHVKWHPNGNPDAYWSAANKDGNNISAIIIYNKPSLKCINYTRDINHGKENADIISLVEFINNQSFSEALKWVCDLCGIDYYSNLDDDIPESIKITKMIYEMQQGEINEEDRPLKPIPEKILTYYKTYVNDMFANDGISYETQREFEIGYDEITNRITIPIRDEIGNLCGIKGRLFKNDLEEWELKYLYIEPCARSKILYGIYKTYSFIKEKGQCIITEAEKGVLQLWDIGYCNSLATGGTKISKQQIEKIIRLGVDLIFAFDKDVTKKEIEDISNKFVDGISIYYIFDDKGILEEKESPTDSKEKFEYLYKNCLYKIK